MGRRGDGLIPIISRIVRSTFFLAFFDLDRPLYLVGRFAYHRSELVCNIQNFFIELSEILASTGSYAMQEVQRESLHSDERDGVYDKHFKVGSAHLALSLAFGAAFENVRRAVIHFATSSVTRAVSPMLIGGSPESTAQAST